METSRRIFELADGWLFGEAGGAGGPKARVSLPHTWNAGDGRSADYRRGAYVYERSWKAGPELAGMRIYLEVDAAASVARVEAGGREVASHRGGYSRFRADISDCLASDGTTLIRITVDNSDVEEVYPLMADFTFFGGLYRGVRVIAVPPCHLDLMDWGSPGVYLSQREVSRERAVIGCEAKVVNEGGAPEALELSVRALDASGTVVAIASQAATVHAETTFFLDLDIPSPHLWQGVIDPYLYRFEVLLLGSGGAAASERVATDARSPTPLDGSSVGLGIRSYSVDSGRGFLLNGIPTPLRGVSRHQDRAGRGNAILPSDMEEDVAIIRELGANTVRLAHYQHADYFYELCDRAGLVLWAEVPVISRLSETDPTGENAVSQLRELIRQNYNHCSICFWGVQNEITICQPTPGLRALVARLG
ncbi:MAG: hypothetical protein KKB59_05740, partial [Spirochaetes bacterium]|nr:hypothetical protein [Spirochaetota bacterium]